MDEGALWIIEILGPAILLIVLVWLVIRNRSKRDDRDGQRSDQGARDVYAEEEVRRREGTDDL